MMGSARVVAIGEDSHGTREFRDALHDATVAAIESNQLQFVMLELGAAFVERPDAYAGGCGPSTLPPIDLADRRSRSVLSTPGFRAFLEAVKRHNEARPAECVRLVGIEAGEGEAPVVGLQALIEGQLTDEAGRDLQRALELHRGWTLERRARDDELRRRALAGLDAAESLLAEPSSWRRHGPPEEVALEIPFWIHLAEQRVTLTRSWSERDRSMADNVMFWTRRLAHERRALLYAHAFHVAAVPYGFKERPQYPMGTHLRAELGDDYRVAALAFGDGTFLAMQPIGTRFRGIHVARVRAPTRECLERRLLARGDAPFVFRPAQECASLGGSCAAMREFGIAYPMGFHELAIDYMAIDVAKAFDAIVFFPHASADR